MVVNGFCSSYSPQRRRTGSKWKPTVNQTLIDTLFPLTCSEWYEHMAEGKVSLLVYHQTLLPNHKEAECWLADMNKVYDVRQG